MWKFVSGRKQFQVIPNYEDDIVVGDVETPAHNDYFADEVEHSLSSLGVSAAEMRDALPLLPTESVAVEAMAEMMNNFGGMRSRLCHEVSSREMFLCGLDEGILGEDHVKTVKNAMS